MPTRTLRARSIWLALLCALTLPLPLWLASPAMAQPATLEASSLQLSARQLKLQEGATEAFRQHRYAQAYGRYVELADAGHPPSARMAMVMLQNGPALFGGEFAATTSQYARWNAVVVNAARRDTYVGIEARTTE